MSGRAVDPRWATWLPMLREHGADHALLRRRFGLEPEADFAERVVEAYAPPAWAVGSVGVLDAMVLRDMVHGVRPREVIEIGTAAGTSALVLARAMAEIDAGGEGPAVHTFDLHPWCYFDRSRAVGSAIDEAEPEVAALIARRVRATAAEAGTLLAGRNVGLAFIDGDHRHPAPCADVLALAPAMAPGAWIVLHDVDLPAAAERYERAKGVSVDWKQHGAKWLFESWPFEKLELVSHRNIGAVRLPTERPIGRADLEACLALPWEVAPEGRGAAILTEA